jgi:hypothetical protein
LKVIVVALVAGVVATLVAVQLPRPVDVVGAIAVGGCVALAVIVGWLVGIVRDREGRLDRIERAITERERRAV